MEKLIELKQYIERLGEGLFLLPNNYSAQIYSRKDTIFISNGDKKIARIEVRDGSKPIWIYMPKEDNGISGTAYRFSLDDNIEKITEFNHPLITELFELLKSM